MGWVNLREVNFLALQTAVFCIGCELISQNNSATCLACGSQALLSLSRVLGGSLRNQQTAHVIADSELDRLVRELIRTMPSPELHTNESASPVSSPSQVSGSHHVRSRSFENPERDTFSDEETQPAEISLQPAINVIAERAQTLTRATGAAIALRKGSEIVCRARTGRTAPDLGVRLQTDSGPGPRQHRFPLATQPIPAVWRRRRFD